MAYEEFSVSITATANTNGIVTVAGSAIRLQRLPESVIRALAIEASAQLLGVPCRLGKRHKMKDGAVMFTMAPHLEGAPME